MCANVVSAPVLVSLGTRIFESVGVPAADAELLADSLVTAELWGHSSHGMLRLPWYLARLRSGAMKAVTDPVTIADTGSLVVMDGRDGIGQVLTAKAVELGIERARTHGIAGVGIRNSNHFGTAAYFTRKAAEAGCVALLATNASPAMAPWGGSRKTVGTNPWSIAAPAGRYGHVVMDIANTAVARGKIYLAAERGEPIPSGWAADERGVPTTDPREAVNGLILPMGGHKGYAMSFMFDILAGVLTGSAFGTGVVGPYKPTGSSGCGHFLMVVDVEAIQPLPEFSARMEALVEQAKSVPPADGFPEVFIPGEIEERNAAMNAESGIRLPDKTWDDLEKIAAELGVDMPAPTAMADWSHTS